MIRANCFPFGGQKNHTKRITGPLYIRHLAFAKFVATRQAFGGNLGEGKIVGTDRTDRASKHKGADLPLGGNPSVMGVCAARDFVGQEHQVAVASCFKRILSTICMACCGSGAFACIRCISV